MVGSHRPRLAEVFPQLARDLKRALTDEGQIDLADQVDSLEIWSRCGCGDWFCASFYTASQEWRGKQTVESVPVESSSVDVVDTLDKKIVFIEVLFNGEVSSKLGEIFSKGSS